MMKIVRNKEMNHHPMQMIKINIDLRSMFLQTSNFVHLVFVNFSLSFHRTVLVILIHHVFVCLPVSLSHCLFVRLFVCLAWRIGEREKAELVDISLRFRLNYQKKTRDYLQVIPDSTNNFSIDRIVSTLFELYHWS